MHVYLIGLPGSGKSFAAPTLAARLGWSWLDLDQQIEQDLNETIAMCLERRGEAYFRSVESEVLQRVSCYADSHVIACGGGATLDGMNRQILSETGIAVWLDTPVERIVERLLRDPGARPLLQKWDGISIERMRLLRLERYEAYSFADCIGESLEDLQERVVELVLASM